MAIARRAALGLALLLSSAACVSGAAVGQPCSQPGDCSSDNCSAAGSDGGICLCSSTTCGRDGDCCGGFCCQGGCQQSPCVTQSCQQAGNCSLGAS